MLKLLKYQTKVKLLPLLALLVFLMVYWLAISETIRLRKETKTMETDAATFERAPAEMARLKRMLEDLNQIAGENKTVSGLDPLMELTSKLTASHQVILSEYQPAHIFNYQNYTIETRVTSFEAPLIPCLKVLYNIEKAYHYGKVVSVNFTTATDYQTSKKRLSMQILIQSIQNGKNTISEN